jgi:hypothetical protein
MDPKTFAINWKVTKAIIIALLLFLLYLLLSGCSPQKRLNRLIKNHPELCKTDSIHRVDTATVPESEFSFLYYDRSFTDTVRIKPRQGVFVQRSVDSSATTQPIYEDDRIIIRTRKVVTEKGPALEVSGKVKQAKAVVNTTTQIRSVVAQRPLFTFWQKFKTGIWILAGIILVLVVTRLLLVIKR